MYSLAGFEMVLQRHSSKYIFSYYIPSGKLHLNPRQMGILNPKRDNGRGGQIVQRRKPDAIFLYSMQQKQGTRDKSSHLLAAKINPKQCQGKYKVKCTIFAGFLVLASWISFLIPSHMITGRTTLLAILFLVMTNMFNAISANMPKAECLTAVEVWMLACTLFIAGAVAE